MPLADPTPPPVVALVYEAPAGCESAGSFAARVEQTGLRLSDSVTEDRHASVLIRKVGAKYTASLRYAQSTQGRESRELRDADCEALARGAAQLLALWSGVHNDAPLPAPEAEAPATPPRVVTPVRADPSNVAIAPTPRYGVQALMAAPTLMLGGDVPAWGGEASLRWGPRSTGAVHWSLEIGLATATAAPAKASLQWYFAPLWACAAPLVHTARIDMQACARAEVGALHAQGEGLSQALAQTKWWSAAGPELRATLNFGGSFGLEAWGAPMVLLNRESFTVGARTVWDPSPVAVRAGIGLAWHPKVAEL